MGRKLAAGLPLAVGALLVGCGGGATARPVDPGLTVHEGKGFSVGYPKAWTRDPKRTVFRGADFEVLQPDPAGGPPRASWSVFTEHEARPLDRLVDGFVARSKTARDFQLLERKKLEGETLDGHDAYVIRKAFSTAPSTAATPATPSATGNQGVQLRQVDLFVRVSPGSVVDVRMVFFADHYDPARQQINAVIGSFRVKT